MKSINVEVPSTKTITLNVVETTEDGVYEIARNWTEEKIQNTMAALEANIKELEENKAPRSVISDQQGGLNKFGRALKIIEDEKIRAVGEKEYNEKVKAQAEEIIGRFPKAYEGKITYDPISRNLEYMNSTIASIETYDEYANKRGTARTKLVIESWHFGGYSANDYFVARRYAETKKTGFFGDKAIETLVDYITARAAQQRRQAEHEQSKLDSKNKLVELGMEQKYAWKNKWEVYGENRERLSIQSVNSGEGFNVEIAGLNEAQMLEIKKIAMEMITFKIEE